MLIVSLYHQAMNMTLFDLDEPFFQSLPVPPPPPSEISAIIESAFFFSAYNLLTGLLVPITSSCGDITLTV